MAFAAAERTNHGSLSANIRRLLNRYRCPGALVRIGFAERVRGGNLGGVPLIRSALPAPPNGEGGKVRMTNTEKLVWGVVFFFNIGVVYGAWLFLIWG